MTTRPPSKRHKPTTITDEEILELILNGQIKLLNLHLPDPICLHRDKPIKATLMGSAKRNGTRYRWEICRNKKRRTIARAKLVYMFVTRSLIPDTHELHHKDNDRYNDAFNNLRLLHREAHQELHNTPPYSYPHEP